MDLGDRPDGSNATALGWVLVVVGVISAFVAPGTETFSAMVFAFGLANLGIGLGVLLLSLGYLVRAISFLPGRDEQTVQTDAPATATSCDWCAQSVKAPGRPCSAVQHDDLVLAAPNVANPKCQTELLARGYLSE